MQKMADQFWLYKTRDGLYAIRRTYHNNLLGIDMYGDIALAYGYPGCYFSFEYESDRLKDFLLWILHYDHYVKKYPLAQPEYIKEYLASLDPIVEIGYKYLKWENTDVLENYHMTELAKAFYRFDSETEGELGL